MDNKLYKKISAPYLVQRCILGASSLQYDYMGSAEFEWGAPQTSMKAMFEAGLVHHQVTLHLAESDVVLHLITRTDFSVDEYKPHLQSLVENKTRLIEQSYLYEKILFLRGVKNSQTEWGKNINVWFDINNAVMITLSEKSAIRLEEELKKIDKIWKDKA